MEYCKLQTGCLLLVAYIAFLYVRERRRYEKKLRPTPFDGLLALGILSLTLDGVTAWTVNRLDTVPAILNLVLHLLFLISLDSIVFLLFLYFLASTEGLPKRKSARFCLFAPYAASIAMVLLNIGSLEYRTGRLSNYSMGVSVYACFIMVGLSIIFTFVVFFRRWNYIESHKRASIFTYLLVMLLLGGYQMLVPDALVTSLGVTIFILGVYLNQENPALRQLSHYHREMVMGFAVLIEGKDGSTGGHVRRTTAYVEVLAKALRDRGHFRDVLTKDYLENLMMAAPMHDIGKISVPDSILQKPGRLTAEEFEIIKRHTVSGGEIIQNTFGHVGNAQYLDMAYNVALHHHEKWNGKGYPTGLKGGEIPLCARIMAIADVFDAVSETRCYRPAMPLNQCFDIIRQGAGKDFDPLLAEVFLDIRPQVEAIHAQVQ